MTARNKLRTSLEYQKNLYDARLREEKFNVGDMVLYCRESATPGKCIKLLPVWIGPWVVIAVAGPVIYRIWNQKREMVMHHNKLKL